MKYQIQDLKSLFYQKRKRTYLQEHEAFPNSLSHFTDNSKKIIFPRINVINVYASNSYGGVNINIK